MCIRDSHTTASELRMLRAGLLAAGRSREVTRKGTTGRPATVLVGYPPSFSAALQEWSESVGDALGVLWMATVAGRDATDWRDHLPSHLTPEMLRAIARTLDPPTA